MFKDAIQSHTILTMPYSVTSELHNGNITTISSVMPGLKASHSPLGPNIRLIVKYAPMTDTRYIINNTIMIVHLFVYSKESFCNFFLLRSCALFHLL